jgi:hypothetical protein
VRLNGRGRGRCDRRDVIKGILFFVGIFVRWRSDSSCIGLRSNRGRLKAKGILEGSLEPRGAYVAYILG